MKEDKSFHINFYESKYRCLEDVDLNIFYHVYDIPKLNLVMKKIVRIISRVKTLTF